MTSQAEGSKTAALLLWTVVLGGPVASQSQVQRPLPPLPLTQLDERTASAEMDNLTFSLTFAQPLAIQDVLLQVVRGTNLSIAPDAAVSGTFTGELKSVTVRQALDLILPPLGLTYTVDGSFVRVFRRALETRIFDLNYLATERTGTATVRGGDDSTASVATATTSDVFSDLASGVRALVSEQAAFNVDRKAGLLQVTDSPDRLDRVAVYLDAVQDRVHRQAEIDARVLEVELADAKARGIDWTALTSQLAADQAGQRSGQKRSLTGMRVTNISRLVALLETQGTVTMLANPRLVTMNNEPSIVRTDAMTLAVTAQISGDSLMTLSVSPLVKAPGTLESSLLARVADGETLVVSGFGVDRETRERKAVGASGGWFGRATVVTRKHVELVVLLTPRILPGVMAP